MKPFKPFKAKMDVQTHLCQGRTLQDSKKYRKNKELHLNWMDKTKMEWMLGLNAQWLAFCTSGETPYNWPITEVEKWQSEAALHPHDLGTSEPLMWPWIPKVICVAGSPEATIIFWWLVCDTVFHTEDVQTFITKERVEKEKTLILAHEHMCFGLSKTLGKRFPSLLQDLSGSARGNRKGYSEVFLLKMIQRLDLVALHGLLCSLLWVTAMKKKHF